LPLRGVYLVYGLRPFMKFIAAGAAFIWLRLLKLGQFKNEREHYPQIRAIGSIE
jgi:hypothetical protein